ncbi:MAG TPA: putative glycoside hydrolase, partial [Bacillota bacterium]|nr:putative glycoside hydrolase [Bacillota bacterium]
MRKYSIVIGLVIIAVILVMATVMPGKFFKSSLAENLHLTAKGLPAMSAAESKADAQELEKKENGQKDLKATDAQKEEAGKNDSGVEAKPSPARPAVTSVSTPTNVKGVYVTGWIAGAPKSMASVINFVDKTEVNSVVIDVKDDEGTLSYKSNVPLAVQTNAGERKVSDIVALLKTLREHNIYPIARIVTFKDPHLAAARPDMAVQDKNGGYWKDRKGLKWVDPYDKEVWKYNVDIAEEAMSYGFKEIQFDYVRFTSDGIIRNCLYSHSDGTPKEDVIKNFLSYAKERLKKYNAIISADVFGLTLSAEDDLGIGQKIEKVGSAVDVLSPMVYPSH